MFRKSLGAHKVQRRVLLLVALFCAYARLRNGCPKSQTVNRDMAASGPLHMGLSERAAIEVESLQAARGMPLRVGHHTRTENLKAEELGYY